MSAYAGNGLQRFPDWEKQRRFSPPIPSPGPANRGFSSIGTSRSEQCKNGKQISRNRTHSRSCYPFQSWIQRKTPMTSMQGRTAVVFGVANKRSIAWAIAQKLRGAGAKVVITYQNERLEQEAKGLIAELPGAEGFRCDVSNDAEIQQLFEQLKSKFGKIHTLVHSVAYAPAEELKNDFLFTTREGFRIAHDVSVYSLIALTRAAVPLMEDGGSVITMSYFGAEKVVPKYNVMGVAKASLEATVRYLAADVGQNKIRVNAISAGPVKTLAARGISGFGDMLKSHAERAPLKRNIDAGEVGDTALFLASDLSTGITGEVIYVDCGYNIMGF